MDLGALIGGAIAGGMAGAGGAAKTSMASSQEAIQKEELMQHEQEAIGMREMALQQSQQGWQGGENDKSRALTASEGAAGRANQVDITKMNNDQSGKNAQLAADTSVKTTGMHDATSLQIASMEQAAAAARAAQQAHLTVEKAADGSYFTFDTRTGQSAGLEIGGKQVMATAELPKASQMVLAGLTAQLRTAQTEEEKAAIMQNINDIGNNRGSAPSSLLSGQKTGRLLAAAQAAKANPNDPAAQTAWANEQKNYDDAMAKVSNGKLGAGSAQRYVQSYQQYTQQITENPNVWHGGGSSMPAKAGSATDTGTAGTMPLPSGGANAGTTANPYLQDDPVAPVNKPPLINGQIPTGVTTGNYAAASGGGAMPARPIDATPAAPVSPQAAAVVAPAAAPAPMAVSNTQPGSPLITGAQAGMVMVNGRLVPAGTLGGPTQ